MFIYQLRTRWALTHERFVCYSHPGLCFSQIPQGFPELGVYRWKILLKWMESTPILGGHDVHLYIYMHFTVQVIFPILAGLLGLTTNNSNILGDKICQMCKPSDSTSLKSLSYEESICTCSEHWNVPVSSKMLIDIWNQPGFAWRWVMGPWFDSMPFGPWFKIATTGWCLNSFAKLVYT